MFLLTPLLFWIVAAAVAAAWHRWFHPIGKRVVIVLVALVTLYHAETFFTSKVDVPADLAFHAYPWKALGSKAVRANNGIVFTQMVPWTENARRQLESGELPLWNRTIGCGSPLLADLQNTIFHPFTLLGMFLAVGKAWTLSSALRLFCCLFFLFVFLRRWELHPLAALFGAIAYSFSTFNALALLFPLGLAMMTLPLSLTAAHEFLERPRRRSFLLLVVALAMAVLGGHPESSTWVALTTGAYALYFAFTRVAPRRTRSIRLSLAALAALAAAALTSPVWYPALSILPHTERYQGLASIGNPPDHHVGFDWIAPLFAPNILGTPQQGSYRTPEPTHPSLPSDYGEVADGYAGALALGLTATALVLCRNRRPTAFFAVAMLIAFLTIYETPGWYFLLRKVPWIGLALHQRWRFLWALGTSICGAVALSEFLEGKLSARDLRRGVAGGAALVGAIYFFWWKEFLVRHIGGEQALWFAISATSVALFVLALKASRERAATVAALAVFVELICLGFRYNPPSSPSNFYPATGAIEAIKRGDSPYRIAALGWSFIPDTPGYYGLEDVKTTDVLQYREYALLFRYFLQIDGGDFNSSIGSVRSPFFDLLNVRYLYVPPEVPFADESFDLVYKGRDGSVFRNRETLPRYFFVKAATIERTFQSAATKVSVIPSFADEATVDHVPAKIAKMAGQALGESPGRSDTRLEFAGGTVAVARYRSNDSSLDVVSRGWNLLVSSDVSMPGWRAYWNGQRLPPVIVNGAFLGSYVPPGRGTLTFRYLPREFEIGCRLAAVTALLMVGAFLLVGRRRARASTAAA